MTSFIMGIVAIIIAVVVVSTKVYIFSKSARCYSLFVILVVSGAIYCNQDLIAWFKFIQERQAITKAKAILANPQSLQTLLANFRKHLELNPQDAKAWFLLGRVYAGQGEWQDAHDALQQSYRLEPNNIKTSLFYVETIWHTQNKITPQARHILIKVLAKEANQPDALMLLATEARERKCPQEAIIYLQKLRDVLMSQEELRKSLDDAIFKAEREDNSQCLPL